MRIDDVDLTRPFIKQLTRLPERRRTRVTEAVRLLLDNADDRALRLHELKGKHTGTYSVSAGGDLRIHFRVVTQGDRIVAALQAVGSHSQLYG